MFICRRDRTDKVIRVVKWVSQEFPSGSGGGLVIQARERISGQVKVGYRCGCNVRD